MENVYGFDQRSQIINELLQGLESAKQLQNQITNKTTPLSDDHQALNHYSLLIEKMMSTFDKTITIAKQINPSNHNNDSQMKLPHSLVVSSPISENSQPDYRSSKRRKMMPRWTKTVHVNPDKSISGLEGPLNDGFSWRKYGQKEILGAKFPRGYYRCTHRHSKGCAATKQVQQSDDDPSIYQVIYQGDHTCCSGPIIKQAQLRPISAHKAKTEPQQSPSPQQEHPTSQPIIQEVYVGLDPKGNLNIEPNELANKAQIFRCFSFNSALLETEPLDNYILSYSPDFASPTTSDSNYFPTSPYRNSEPHLGLTVQTSESDINGPISGPNSVNNSPTMGDFEFPLDQWLDLDPTFF